MEESFDIIIAIIAIVSGLAGVAAKSRKKEKKKAENKPKEFNWEEAGELIEKRFNEFVHGEEEEEGDDEAEAAGPAIPYAPSPDHAIATAIPIPTAPPPVMPVQPMPSTEGKATEGVACDLHANMKPVAVKKANEPILVERAHTRSSLNPGRMTTAQLRSAFIMSEVIGKPVALRKRVSAR